MTVYNADKTQILDTYDLEAGQLIPDTITRHISAVQGQDEEGYFDQSNGGKYVVTQKYIKSVPEHDEEEPIYRYVLYSVAELSARAKAKRRLEIEAEIKAEEEYLSSTDYMVIKCLERGLDMATEYAEAYAKRQTARDNINALRAELEEN